MKGSGRKWSAGGSYGGPNPDAARGGHAGAMPPAGGLPPGARADGPAGGVGQQPGTGAPPPSIHEPPPGAGLMNAVRWALFAALLLLAVASIGAYVISKQPKHAAGAQSKKVIYQCPMHPSYTSDKPGECPICGMTLEKVELTDGPASHAGMGHEGNVPGLTAVHITPERVQLIGVRTVVVGKRSLGGTLDLVGFITPDETRLRRIQIRVSGWVQQLFVNRTGERVAAGQPLLSIYSPELYQTEREYLIERATMDSVSGDSHDAGAAGAAAERLRLLGVPDEEVRRLEREGTAATQLTLRSPVTGTVLERGVVEGQYVGADTPLFSVADLARVWVLADLYEMDLSRVRVGDRARLVAGALPGHPFEGRIEFVYPTISNETRTLKLRMSVENRDGLLRPGMYGRVQVTGSARPTLAVPGEAVINTGQYDYVFIAHTGGHFEPRMVEAGLQDGDWMPILKGLAAGDTVVASASFLIDSESRLKAAIAGMGGQPAGGHQHGGTP